MGGRGSGGGKGGGGGGATKKIPTGEGITDKNELINLYNSISGNSNLSVEQRVKAMHDIEERIKELDAKKQADLKQKRLDALAKARAKRAENKNNGIKPEKKEKDPRKTKPKMSMDSTVSELKYQLKRQIDKSNMVDNSDIHLSDYGTHKTLFIRYLGKWKNPPEARYEEDYDWQILEKSSGKQINKVIKSIAKQSGRKLKWGTGEKNYVEIDIPKMKGD